MARWLGTTQATGSHKNMFLAGYPRTNGLSVANDYGNILDGDTPTCFDSTWPVRTCSAAQFVLFMICLDLSGRRGIADATSRPRGPYQ